MADETQKTLIDITALKYFYKSLQNVTVLIAPSSIEAASASNLGRTYFIPVDGTYAGVKCSKGDHIVSNGVAWILIPKGTSEGGKEYFAGTGIDISTVDGKDVISNTGVRKIGKADESHPGTIKVTIGNNNPEYIEVAGLDTAAFMPYETELTEDSDDTIPTSKAVADYVADEIADLSVADSEVKGQYVASVAQEDGKITINRQSLPTPKDTYDATSSEAISGKGVKDAIKGKQDSLSADQMSAVNSGITADLKANYDTAYAYSQETHARVDATKVEASETNGKIKINDVDTTVYTHPGTGTNPHGTTKADVGLSNVGNFKAVSTVASQGLTDTEKANAKANLGISDASSMGVDTSITASASNNNVPTSKAVKDYVDTEIENLPEPMIFKGSVGTGGTITSLPTAAKANMGFTYKVITAGTYASQSAKVGDTFISTGTAWELIPSGDEPSGTVTSVGVSVPTGLSVSGTPVTTSGTIAISMASGYSIPTTAKQEAWDGKSVVAKSDTNGSIKINGTDTVVYTHPTGTNPHGTTKSDVGLGNVGNFKAVSTVASQGLTNTEKSNARANIGAGTYSKASTGIPKTDLASAVQTSLGLADTALQSHQSLEDYVKTTDSRLTDARASNDVQAYAKTGSGITVGVSVPSNAKFTDTTYSVATTSANGLMSSSDKTKLNGIATGATAVSESTVSGWGFTKNAGTVTKVKVGSSGTEYSPSSGVVTIPAYPTSLPASDVQAYAKTGSGITVAKSVPSDAKFTDTTYSSKTAASGGTDVSLVTTGEKATWNAKQNALTSQTAYSAKGSATKVPQITTNSLGQVTGITEVTITQPTVNNATLTIQKNGTNVGTFTANASTNSTVNITVPTGAAANKGVDTSIASSATDNNVPTTKAVKTALDNKVQKTSVSSGENSTTSVINVTDAKAQMAMVASIKGKTVKDGTTLKSAAVESVVSEGSNHFSFDNMYDLRASVTAVGNGYYKILSTAAWSYTNTRVYNLKVNTKYKIFIDTSEKSAANLYVAVKRKDANTNYNTLTLNAGQVTSYEFTALETEAVISINPNNSATASTTAYVTVRIAIIESSLNPTGYVPYNKTTVLVPQAIRNLPDYGVENNIVDFENGTYTHNNTISNGAVAAYTGTDKVIPITDYLRPLPVENGGTITLVNEHNLDVNSTIKYKKEV